MTPASAARACRLKWFRPQTRSDVQRLQSHLLRSLVHHAYTNVPYYRRLLDEAGIAPTTFRGIEDLSRIPITERSDLQSLPESDRCAGGIWHRASRVVQTSGSSGSPLLVRRTAAEDALALALRAQAVGRWGFGMRARRVNIDHFNPEALKTEAKPKAYERVGIMPRLNLDWRMPKREILNRMGRFRPDLISGPPSILAELADQLSDEDRAGLTAERILTGSEKLTRSARQRIETGFAAPVTDIYGCCETLFIAMETPGNSGYRVCDESVIVEVIDGDAASTHGEIVITSLHQWAMPFLRYRLGDDVEIAKHSGPHTMLASIDGRKTDRFVLPDGRRLHCYLLGEVLESSSFAVRQFQITQERRDRFRVRTVIEGPADMDSLKRRYQSLLGDGVEVLIERVDLIERQGRKFYPFVPLERFHAGSQAIDS